MLELEYRTVLKTVALKGLRDRSPSPAPIDKAKSLKLAQKRELVQNRFGLANLSAEEASNNGCLQIMLRIRSVISSKVNKGYRLNE